MAVLTNPQRIEVRQAWTKDLSDRFEEMGLTKTDQQAAINAADQWVEDNKVSYNQALPALAQSTLTASQKAELLVFVVDKRYEVGA